MPRTFSNRWEIVKSLSEGGQGRTFVVRDLQDKTGTATYVLKQLKNLERLDRFKNELEASLKMNHQNILKVIAHDLTGKEPFIVTEYCEGGTLRTLFSVGKPSLHETFRIFLGIAAGLEHAHRLKIIHRDIKPDNIFLRLPQSEPVIGDFGLCYLSETDERITITEEAIGPRYFMAPELEDGRADKINSSADIYSLGKLLYWMVSGGKVFSREKFRDEQWDLKKLVPHSFMDGDNHEMEHITRLLEHMIVAEPTQRALLPDIISSAKRIQSLIHRGVNPVGKSIPQICTYCGWGKYSEIAKGGNVHNFGLNQVGNPNRKVLACSECGHIQLFRLDHITGNNWWIQETRLK